MNITFFVAVIFLCQDDDSDLDYELEAIPTVTPEASAEVVACVKVNLCTNCLSMSMFWDTYYVCFVTKKLLCDFEALPYLEDSKMFESIN